ncbi:hypothetical protein G647_09967 [Cladophialophora carrionii CBS 160.54]|uniref:Uncharacterized protein n=1 Tax=Cladophialophora carrionii CBS 160.54 TaxID=1279043 RepID=V9DKP6_9EURO|nr:uncharacterized protein G647_09967 [Cladophialophora carrionii CBS 160.54]ETI26868.1 hypothetical protein G647_09967 [Cladophialophora carrionii CBS 160.54]
MEPGQLVSGLSEDEAQLAISDYFPSDGEDDVYLTDEDDIYSTDEDEFHEPAQLQERLGELAVFIQEDNSVPALPNLPPLPSGFTELERQSELRERVSQNVALIRQLELRTSYSVNFCLDEIDRDGLLKDFHICISAAFGKMLLSQKPPTLESYLALPDALTLDKGVLTNYLVVYICIFQKHGQPEFRPYSGSALSVVTGASARISQYQGVVAHGSASVSWDQLSINSKKS